MFENYLYIFSYCSHLCYCIHNVLATVPTNIFRCLLLWSCIEARVNLKFWKVIDYDKRHLKKTGRYCSKMIR